MTWTQLLLFLASEREKGNINLDSHVMIHNIETGDEYTCDTLVFENTNRLVLSINNE